MNNIIKWKGCTLQPLTTEEYQNTTAQGGCLQGYVDVTYRELVGLFGEATLGESGDGKCQMEWVFEITDEDGKMEQFYIYDWKTYDLNVTKNHLKTWNIGGNSNPHILIKYITEQKANLEATMKEFTFSVPCSLKYTLWAKDEDTALEILKEKGGYDIQGEVLVDASDYDDAILI
tara:strand:- start:14421 stop:14945 length:525 start_codon:yes stop_codon:yes gene_type:complete